MAIKELQKLCEEAKKKFAIAGISICHRIGEVVIIYKLGMIFRQLVKLLLI